MKVRQHIPRFNAGNDLARTPTGLSARLDFEGPAWAPIQATAQRLNQALRAFNVSAAEPLAVEPPKQVTASTPVDAAPAGLPNFIAQALASKPEPDFDELTAEDIARLRVTHPHLFPDSDHEEHEEGTK